MLYVLQRRLGVLMRDGQQSVLCRSRLSVHQIHDRTLGLTHDSSMWYIEKIPHTRGMPMVSASETGGAVHSLLHDNPIATGRHDERVEVDLKSIGNAVVVN